MNKLRRLVQRLFRKTTTENALDEELRSYLAHDIEARVASGVDPVDARRQALAEFGGVEQVKEIVRENRAGAWVDSLLQDLRYAFRTLGQSRMFALSVIGSLSLGIAVTIVGFAFINALMYRQFPGVQHQDELVELRLLTGCNGCYFPSTQDDYIGLRDGMSAFSSFTAFSTSNVVYEARLVAAAFVFPSYFETLGAQPLMGRGLAASDVDAVVIGNTMWEHEFGWDPSIVGKAIRIGSRSVQIVGVASPDFQGLQRPDLGSRTVDFWLPMASAADLATWGSNGPFLRLIGRRKPGAQLQAIRAEADIVFSQLAVARQKISTPGRVDAVEVGTLDPVRRAALTALIMLVPILVLLVSCVNATNMLFGRAASRDHEIAIRLSMGAPRWRVVRQLMIENLILSMASAIASVPIAASALGLVSKQFFGTPMPIDVHVLAATILTAFTCAFAFGLTPALRMTSLNPGRTLVGNGSPLQVQMRRGLVIGQVALSLALLAVGTQLVTSLLAMGAVAGVQADRLLLASFNLDQIKLPPDQAESFYQRVVERVSKLPQAEAVGVGPALWFFGGHVISPGEVHSLRFWGPGTAPDDRKGARGGTVDSGMFQAVGMPLLEGRWFTDEDRRPSIPEVAIVNRAFAKTVMDGPAVGRVIRLAGTEQKYESSVEVMIVGVVENFSEPRNDRNGFGPGSFIYIPKPLDSEAARVLYVRGHGSMKTLSSTVAKAVREVDPRVPIGNLGSLDELNYRSLPEAQLAQGAELFGFVALVLATFGMYGVMSFSVSQRSREIAIRMALGADGRGILKMVLKQAMLLALPGTIIGSILAVIASLWLQRTNRAQFGIHRAAFAGSGLLLIAAMFLASAIPALRASRVDPIDNLRQD